MLFPIILIPVMFHFIEGTDPEPPTTDDIKTICNFTNDELICHSDANNEFKPCKEIYEIEICEKIEQVLKGKEKVNELTSAEEIEENGENDENKKYDEVVFVIRNETQNQDENQHQIKPKEEENKRQRTKGRKVVVVVRNREQERQIAAKNKKVEIDAENVWKRQQEKDKLEKSLEGAKKRRYEILVLRKSKLHEENINKEKHKVNETVSPA